jgi:histidinol-phosphate aminotransferase
MRPEICAMEGYVPVEPPEILAARHGIAPDRIVKLDANENPYGCSLRVQEALASFDRYQIYPDPYQEQLRTRLESHIGFNRERILLGAGADDLIDLIVRLFLRPGDEVINCPPSFGMYPFCTNVCGGRVIDVPRDAKYDVDVAAVLNAVNDRTKVIFLCSPNNPTGNPISQAELVPLLKTERVIVVDEAYVEFSGQSIMPLAAEFDNLIVLRTFSKWAGLAGLRVGYGVFPPEVMQQLWKIKQPYNVNVAAQVAVMASLDDAEQLMNKVKLIRQERGRMFRQLRKLNYLEPYPSQANFILCKITRGNAVQVRQELQKDAVFVRYYNTSLLRDFIRISVGKPEDTDVLMASLLRISTIV